MSNILIVTSRCFEDVDANGVCARDLKDALNKLGHKVYLLGYTSIKEYSSKCNDEFCFYKAKGNKYNSSLIRNKIKRLFVPLYNKNLLNDYLKYANEIIDKYEIDAVISIYFPLESELLLTKIKNVKKIAYEVDSSTNVKMNLGRLDNLYNKSYIRFKNKIYSKIDNVLVLKSHINHFLKTYKCNNKKIVECDLPIIKYKKNENISNNKKNTIDFFYTGSLVKEFYSPKRMIEFFANNIDKKNWRLHFYTKGSCEDEIAEATIHDKRIIQHGYVSLEKLEKAKQNADIFMSLETINKPNSLSSKTFKYMNDCKPIIHFANKGSIMAKEYISRYPLGFAIYDVDDNARAVNFIEEIMNKYISIEEVMEIFKENTAEYNAKLISSIIENKD